MRMSGLGRIGEIMDWIRSAEEGAGWVFEGSGETGFLAMPLFVIAGGGSANAVVVPLSLSLSKRHSEVSHFQ